MRNTVAFAFILGLLFSPASSNAGLKATTNDRCPATLTLSSFEKAMTASLNNQDRVVAKMEAEGKIVIIESGTTGYIEDERKVLGGQMEVVRFVYPLNPNGFYGVWTLKNCFNIQSQYNTNKVPKFPQYDYEPQIGYLYVETSPENSKIRILNIRPKFYQGIKLEPGKYHIEVSATGYSTKKKWIIMPVDGSQRESFKLKKNQKAEWTETNKHLNEKKRKLVEERANLKEERRKLEEEKRQVEKMKQILTEREKDEKEWALIVERRKKIEKQAKINEDFQKVNKKSRDSNLSLASATKTITGMYQFENGIIYDPITKLEWYTGPNKEFSWYEANKWVRDLDVDGRGWNLPSLIELKSLYFVGVGSRNIDPAFELSGSWVWSRKTRGVSHAWFFGFLTDKRDWGSRRYFVNLRVLAVRSRTESSLRKTQNGYQDEQPLNIDPPL